MAGIIGAELAEIASYVASRIGSRATYNSLAAAGFTTEVLSHLNDLYKAGHDIYDTVRSIAAGHSSSKVPKTPNLRRPTSRPTMSPGHNPRTRLDFGHSRSEPATDQELETVTDQESASLQFPPGTTADTRIAMTSAHQFNTGDEVPVVPPPNKIAKIIPDYTTIKMPWHEYFILTLHGGNTPKNRDVYWFRLNSVQDPSLQFLSSGTPTSISTHRPNPYATWNTLYKYYRVLETDVHLRFYMRKWEILRQADRDIGGNIPSVICGYQLNDDASQEYPNAVACIEGKQSKNMWLDARDMEYIPNKAAGTDLGDYSVVYSGGVRECDFHYDPKKWDYHIRDNVVDQRWTLMSTNPEDSHLIGVHIYTPFRSGENLPSNNPVNVRVDVNMTFTVQLREHILSLDHESGTV